MKWEHQVKLLGSKTGARLQELLDTEGRQGWELAAPYPDDQGLVGVFKRAVDRVAH
jgi:hypothetical protein